MNLQTEYQWTKMQIIIRLNTRMPCVDAIQVIVMHPHSVESLSLQEPEGGVDVLSDCYIKL